MTRLEWDKVGERLYETGTDRGVLYLPNSLGAYDSGHPWNGLTGVTESPEGAEATAQYADNIKYLNLVSAESLNGTINAFTYPKAWAQCDGSAMPEDGVYVGQQTRKSFGLSYRTLLGNDLEANDYGYKLHLVWGALAAPSEKEYTTVNDSPEPVEFSWEFSTTPVSVPNLKPTASITIVSTEVSPAALAALEEILYGTVSTDARLPLPAEVIALFAGTVTTVVATEPVFNEATNVITIPTIAGVRYINKTTGTVLTAGALDALDEDESIFIEAQALPTYRLETGRDYDWYYVGGDLT